MPIPLAAVALGISAGSSIIGYAGAKEADQNAKDKAKHDSELMRAATEVQVDSILAAKTEAEKATVEKMSDMARAAIIERGRIIAAAGEAGVAGGSVSRQLLQSFQYEATSRGRELYNLSAQKRQYNRDIAAAEAGLQVNLPQAQKLAPTAGAAILGGALEALTVGFNTGLFKT